MENIIVGVILLAIVAGIIWYIVRAKKQGATCIGCPYSKKCKGKCGCCSGVPNKKDVNR